MAINEAGIRLILEAPRVKGVMDEIIDDWKEISRQEKEANDRAKAYEDHLNSMTDKLNAQTQAAQKLKDMVKEIDKAQSEKADKELFDQENGRKGIFGTIKAYFAQKAELKNLEKQINSVNKELIQLDLRQRAISLSARRGNSVAIAEYNANEKKIKALSNSLGDLNEKLDVTSAKTQLSAQKFSGLSKVFSVVKAGALLAVTAITAIAVAGLALIIAIGKNNDVVKNQFEKTSKAFDKFKDSLSTALAPVALAIGFILENMANKLTKNIDDNKQAIFDWAVGVAGRIAGTVAYIGAAFDQLSAFFKKATIDFKIIAKDIAFLTDIVNLKFGKAVKASNASDDLRAQYDALAESTKNLISPIEAYNKASDEMTAKLNKIGLAGASVENLTQEQIDALKKLNEQFSSMRENLQKLLNDQAIKDAGPFQGVILKAEVTVKELQKARDEFLKTATALHKAKSVLDAITQSYNGLIEAVRREAVKSLTDQARDEIDKLIDKLDELKAKRAGAESSLRFKRDLEDQLKSLQGISDRLLPVIKRSQDEITIARREGRKVDEQIIAEGVDAQAKLLKAANIANELANITALDQFKDQAVKTVTETKNQVEAQISVLKDKGEELQKVFDSLDDPIFKEEKKNVEISIKINALDLAVAQEQAKQLKESLDIFSKTGVLGVVESEANIRLRLTNKQKVSDEIAELTHERDVHVTVKVKKGFAVSVLDAVNDLKKTLDEAFGDGWEQRVANAWDFVREVSTNSIDAQLEALNRLVDERHNAVVELEDDIKFEAELKANHLANDFDLLRVQLAEKKKLESEAIAQELALKEKAAKRQRDQDTLRQASSLSSAVADYFKSFAGIPFGVGQVLALATIAAMFTAFAASKIKASKLARAYRGSERVGQTYGELAPGEGYNDAPGHDRGLQVVDRKGRLRGYLGGDEFLHKESVSRQHRPFLAYLNKNENQFKGVNLLKLIHEAPAVPRFDFSRVSAKIERYREKVVVVQSQSNGISKKVLKEAIREVIKEQTQALIDYHESRPDIYPNEWLKNYTVMNSKSKKTVRGG